MTDEVILPPLSPVASDTTQIEVPEPKFKEPKRHNPVGILIANLLTFGVVGYWLMGQKMKARAAFVYTMLLSLLLVGLATPVIAAIDGFMVATRIQNGEAVDSEYCALKFIDKLPLWTDMGEV
jgi:hypothetical protein